jgi:molybdate transport system substrate-binding protein
MEGAQRERLGYNRLGAKGILGAKDMKLRFVIAALMLAGLPLAAQIRVVASNGVKAAIEDLRPQLERAAGQPVRIEYGTSTSLAQKIESGEAFDVAILTSELIDALTKAGKLAPGAKAELGRAGIGVGVRKGAKKPDIRTADAFKRTLLDAKAITYAGDGASRATLERSFERMGIAEQMKSKTILEQGSTRAAARVANGDAELILTLVSEILPAPGVELVGPIPDEYQTYVGFAAGVSAKPGNSPGAAAVIKFLSGPAVAPVLKAKGMEAP